MSHPEKPSVARTADLVVKIAATEEEKRKAFGLRYEVFVEEASNDRLRNEVHLERDPFDTYCDHLIVEDRNTGEVVGTYRLLPGARADGGIGFYSETEFNLTGLASMRARTVELGRSCVAPAYRDGKVIQLLWEGIARYINSHSLDYMIGCASFPMKGIQSINETYTWLRRKSILTDRYGILPITSHRITGLQELEDVPDEREWQRSLPPLMKGYQWLGAEIAGEPAYDPIFQTVDFFIVLERSKVERRYKRHFMPEAATV